MFAPCRIVAARSAARPITIVVSLPEAGADPGFLVDGVTEKLEYIRFLFLASVTTYILMVH